MLDEDDARGPPPTAASIAASLGFSVPEGLLDLAQFAYNEAGPDRDRSEIGSIVQSVVGFDFDPAVFGERTEQRYYVPPPEYVPFGWTGCDGVSLGFLVHAPELLRDDWPLVVADPYRHEDGARRLADTFREAIEATASWAFRLDDEPNPAQDALRARLAATLECAPSRTKARPLGRLAARTPSVPQGWLYRRGLDGIGVLAPKGAFAPAHRTQPLKTRRARTLHYDDLRVSTESGQQHLRAGHPASALSVLNDAYHAAGGYCRRDVFDALFPLRLQAYRALERVLHANALERTLGP